MPYFHVVFTLPAPIADIAYTNKAVIYDILFKASAQATITIAADKKRLGAKVGITSVLHTWGSAMTHHPHVHMIVPGGGLSDDGVSGSPAGRSSSCLCGCYRGCSAGSSIEMLSTAHASGKLVFFGQHAGLVDEDAFAAFLAPLKRCEWVVYAKQPFAGPEAVLAYLSLYTHRVAISNRRLVTADADTVTFNYKDYRVDGRRAFQDDDARDGRVHPPLPQPRAAEGLPSHPPLRPAGKRQSGRQRSQGERAARSAAPARRARAGSTRCRRAARSLASLSRAVAARMLIIEEFARGCEPKLAADSSAAIRIDTS